MSTLTARTLITAIGTVEYPVITTSSDGLIEDISSDPSIRSTAVLTPTFLDIHIHGAAGQDLMRATPDGIATIARFLGGKGTSHYLPTTVAATDDDLLATLARLATAIEFPTPNDQAIPIGIHLEGPFFSHAKRGAHPIALLQEPSIALFDRYQQAARGHIKLMTIAPELPGALDLIRHARSLGVRISLGHTNATYTEALGGITAGATTATHTYNAMRALDHREPGVVGAVLEDSDLYADLICDGIHVAPTLVRLWLRLKQERAILITDGISATGMPDGDYSLGSFAVTVKDHRASLVGHPETLAGSVLTLDRAVANLQAFTGCTLDQAVRCASSQPAEMLGLGKSIASLRPGQPANFNQFSDTGRLEATYLNGSRL